jgi:hypothetical protein
MFHHSSLDVINRTRRERERHAEQQRLARTLRRCGTGTRGLRNASRRSRTGR